MPECSHDLLDYSIMRCSRCGATAEEIRLGYIPSRAPHQPIQPHHNEIMFELLKRLRTIVS